MEFSYHTCCVNSTAKAINDMVERARDITLATLRKHCQGLNEWAQGMSYSIGPERGLHLKDDYHVSYHKSVYKGSPCYYIRHSAIEYIWIKA